VVFKGAGFTDDVDGQALDVVHCGKLIKAKREPAASTSRTGRHRHFAGGHQPSKLADALTALDQALSARCRFASTGAPISSDAQVMAFKLRLCHA
jgi:hypothetical protein